MLLVEYSLLTFHSLKYRPESLISNINTIGLVQAVIKNLAKFVFRTHSFFFILQISLPRYRDMCLVSLQEG